MMKDILPIGKGIDNVGDAVFSFVNSLGTVFN